MKLIKSAKEKQKRKWQNENEDKNAPTGSLRNFDDLVLLSLGRFWRHHIGTGVDEKLPPANGGNPGWRWAAPCQPTTEMSSFTRTKLNNDREGEKEKSLYLKTRRGKWLLMQHTAKLFQTCFLLYQTLSKNNGSGFTSYRPTAGRTLL